MKQHDVVFHLWKEQVFPKKPCGHQDRTLIKTYAVKQRAEQQKFHLYEQDAHQGLEGINMYTIERSEVS